MFDIFCTNCSAYLPSGTLCPRCGFRRSAIHIPTPPGRPIWQVKVAGSVGARVAYVKLQSNEAGVVAPWSITPRRENGHASNGGVTLLHGDDGHILWDHRVGMPIEGGVAIYENDGLVIAGAGARSPGAGQGSLCALDLYTGEVRWQKQMGGSVRSVPVVDGSKVFATASDGSVYCMEVSTGQLIWRTVVCQEGTTIPASPLILKDHDYIQSVIIGTYGGPQGREDGKLIALDERGRKLWEQKTGGNVRGTPAIDHDSVYVSSFRNAPSAGIIMAFDVRTGKPLWPEPFKVQGQPSDSKSYGFAASPLIASNSLSIGSLNGQMFALYTTNGKPIWDSKRNIGGPIATAAAAVENLLIFGSNDGSVYAIDTMNGERVWDYALGGAVLTSATVKDGVVYIGSDNGMVAALAWHDGLYIKAAEYLELATRFNEAAECRALSAHFSFQRDVQLRDYQRAADDWTNAGMPDKAAEMWQALGNDERAAATYAAAGERWRMHQPELAAKYYMKSAVLHYKMRHQTELNECTRSLATCLRLPYILLQAVNVGNFIQWEEGEFTLRLSNEGAAPISGGVSLWMGGALKSAQQAVIESPLQPGQSWNIPLRITPTRRQSSLEVEIEYMSGIPVIGMLHGMLSIPIDAVEPLQKPIQFGDVGMLRLTIAGTTAEGLQILTHDVGAVRAEGAIGAVNAEGDIGSVNAKSVGQSG